MSPTSGVGGDDAFFNDMLSKPRPPPPQAPAATPPPPAAAAAAAGSAPTVRSRRPAAPPGTKRPVGGSSAGARPTSTAGQRKPVSARPSAPTAATTVKPASYYLNNDATTTTSSNNNSNHNRENINPAAATQMFYSPAAPTVMQPQPSSAPTSYYGASTAGGADPSSDWYTPSSMSVMAPVHHHQQQQQQYVEQQQQQPQPTIMNPYMPQPLGSMDTHATDPSFLSSEDPYANEPPLMEELGINVEHIAWKTRAVVLPFSRWVVRMRNKGFQHNHNDDDHDDNPMLNPQLMAQDADLAGPIAFAVLLGAELLLAGKLQFGYIYGFGLFGCLSMTLILNLLQPLPEVARLTSDPTILPVPAAATTGISFWSVTSILGYSLLPVNVLAAFKLVLVNNPFWKLHTLLRISAVITIAWSTIASTRLFEQGFGFRHQRYLIAYPIALLYSAFVLITTF